MRAQNDGWCSITLFQTSVGDVFLSKEKLWSLWSWSGSGWAVLPWANAFTLQLAQPRVKLYPSFFFFPLTLCVSVSERKEVKGYLHGVLYPQQVLRASLDLCQAFWTRPQKTEICCICSHEIDSPLFGLSPLCLLRIIPTSECVFLSQQADLFQLFLLLLFNDIQREQLTSRVTATFKKDLLLKVCLLPGDKTQSVFFIIAPESADEQVQVLSWNCWALAAEQLMKHRLFCNISDALWQPPWSRRLRASLTTPTVRLPERSNAKWYSTELTWAKTAS